MFTYWPNGRTDGQDGSWGTIANENVLFGKLKSRSAVCQEDVACVLSPAPNEMAINLNFIRQLSL